jgi:hypothetical protein
MAAISPHQLIIQLLDMRLKALVLLKELSVAILNVLDGAVLGFTWSAYSSKQRHWWVPVAVTS